MPLIFLLAIGGYIIAFTVSYFVIWLGIKILKIEGVTKKKIVIYIFLMLIIGYLLSPFENRVLAIIHNIFFFYLVSIIFSLLTNLLILKYYFLLSGKKLWQLTSYLVAIGFIASLALTLLNNRF
jgi:hypothetical protein